MVGYSIVLLIWLGLTALPFVVHRLTASRRAAKARAALGEPIRSGTALEEGVVTLVGSLVERNADSLEGPDGARSLMVTLGGEGRRGDLGVQELLQETRVAKIALVLSDGTKVTIDGICALVEGPRQTMRHRFGRLPRAWRARSERLFGQVPSATSARLSWARADTRLRVRGSLARRAGVEGVEYRADAVEWVLSPARDEEPVRMVSSCRGDGDGTCVVRAESERLTRAPYGPRPEPRPSPWAPVARTAHPVRTSLAPFSSVRSSA